MKIKADSPSPISNNFGQGMSLFELAQGSTAGDLDQLFEKWDVTIPAAQFLNNIRQKAQEYVEDTGVKDGDSFSFDLDYDPNYPDKSYELIATKPLSYYGTVRGTVGVTKGMKGDNYLVPNDPDSYKVNIDSISLEFWDPEGDHVEGKFEFTN